MRILPFAFLASMLLSQPLSSQVALIQEGSFCSYFKGTQAPPLNWAERGFVPQGPNWYQGVTGIGYGDGDDATVLEDMRGSYISVFIRIPFEIEEDLNFSVGILKVRYDDGFVAYIDGTEVARRGLTGTPPSFDEPASLHEITNPAGFDEQIVIPNLSEILSSPGEHVLAVEVHNATLNSSDLSFSAELLVAPFVLTAVLPAFGPLEGGDTVTIEGFGFSTEETPTVTFGSREATEVTVLDSQTLRAVVPPAASAGPVDVTVRYSQGSFSLPQGYTYVSGQTMGLAFDGQDFAQASSIPSRLNQATFEIWFRSPGRFFWSPLLTVVDGETELLRIELRSRNRIRVRNYVNGSWSTIGGRANLGEDWHHLAFCFDSSGRDLYFDGRLLAQDSTAVFLPPGVSVRLGAGLGLQSNFVGQVQSLKIWPVRRSQSEIQRFAFAPLGEEEGVGSSWLLKEGTGQIAQDWGAWHIPLVLGQSEAEEDSDPQWIFLEDFPQVAITAVDPPKGPGEGGNWVNVYGIGFESEEVPEVYFGDKRSEQVEVESDWELSVLVPSADVFGPVEVKVVASAGTTVLEEGYTYEFTKAVTFIEEGDLWFYFIGVAAPPSDWKEIDFDPAEENWLQGPTGIGYGDGDDATLVDSMQNSAVTLYVRKEFEFEGDPSKLKYLVMRIRYDDGYVVYLNGQEIARANVAGFPPAFDETASNNHEITVGSGEFDEEIDILSYANLLREGTNVIAAEVHNVSLDSSDLSFSLELVGGPVEGGGNGGVQFIRGDVNRDGLITVSDAISLLYGLFLGRELSCLEAADVDDNGVLSVTDAILIVRFLFVSGPPPKAPFPQPGPDLDEDNMSCEK